jgi:hypothetical protein
VPFLQQHDGFVFDSGESLHPSRIQNLYDRQAEKGRGPSQDPVLIRHRPCGTWSVRSRTQSRQRPSSGPRSRCAPHRARTMTSSSLNV